MNGTAGGDHGLGRSVGGWSQAPEGFAEPEPGSAPARPELRYDRRGLIGVGGMGRVHVALDRRLEREVAVKTSLRQDEAARRRFEREAKLTARLDHPGIVPIHDIAVDAEGRSFYTMRLVRGRSLGDHLREARTLDERLALLRHLRDACETVAFAHSRGIVHRDLKPDNIMIGEFGESQIVDWGLAAELRELRDPAVARSGVGTPRFASPEQAAGRAMDERSDIWSLGVVLRELLGGAAEVAHGQPGSEVPPELAAICATATADEPSARFDSVKAMADELTRYLEGRRVLSHAYSPWELLRRLVAAWRVPLAVALAALVVVGLSTTSAWRRTQAEHGRAQAAERDALLAARDATRSRDRADALLARSLLDQALDARARGAHAEAELLAAHANLLRPAAAAVGVLTATQPRAQPRRSGSRAIRSCERGQLSPGGGNLLCVAPGEVSIRASGSLEVLWRRPARDARAAFVDDDAVVFVDELSPDAFTIWDWRRDRALGQLPYSTPVAFHGSHLTSFERDVVELIDLRSGRQRRFRACPSRVVLSALSPDQSELAVFCLDVSARFLTLDGAPRERRLLPFDEAFSPSAMVWTEAGLFVASWSGELVRVDVGDGTRSWSTALPGPINRIEVGPELLAASTDQSAVVLVELATGRRVAELPERDRELVGFDTDGELLTMTADELHRWKLPEDGGTGVFDHGQGLGLSSAGLSPDGRLLALAGGDGVVSLWSRDTGRRLHDLSWQGDVVKDARFSPSGRLLAASGMATTGVVLLDTQTWTRSAAYGPELCRRVAWLAEDQLICLTYGASYLHVDLREGPAVVEVRALPASCRDVTFDGEELLLWCEDDTLRRLLDAVVVAELPPGAQAVAARGDRLAYARPRGVELEDRILEHAQVHALAFSHDGRWLASGALDGSIRVWAVDDGRLLAELSGHRGRISSLRFARGERALLSGSWDGSARLWRLDPLVRAPEELLREVEAAWGLDLDDVLHR